MEDKKLLEFEEKQIHDNTQVKMVFPLKEAQGVEFDCVVGKNRGVEEENRRIRGPYY